MKSLHWTFCAALAAYAAVLAVHHDTPVDLALPLIAVAVTAVAAVSYSSLMLGVVLLVAAEIAIADETMRLLAFGAVVASVVAIAMSHRPSPDAERSAAPGEGRPLSLLIPIWTIVLLRWIPTERVQTGRELFLLAVCAAIVFLLGRTPFALMVGVATALVTPAVPLRTLALPLAVLAIAAFARLFGMPRLWLTWPSTAIVAFALLFFAWSGVVARALPYFLRKAAPELPRHAVAMALAPGRSVELDVPEHAKSLIVSGANVAHFRRGAILGRIDPGGREVRIGDAADWGALRVEVAYGARNPLPRDPAGKVRGYGYDAWIDGAGRVALPRGARTIRVTGDPSLPPDASLQVEGFE